MIESGYPDYLLTFWTGILAPAGTPPDIVGKLNAAINEGLSSADMKQSLAKFNVEPNIASPQEFSTFLAAEARKWADIVKATEHQGRVSSSRMSSTRSPAMTVRRIASVRDHRDRPRARPPQARRPRKPIRTGRSS